MEERKGGAWEAHGEHEEHVEEHEEHEEKREEKRESVRKWKAADEHRLEKVH